MIVHKKCEGDQDWDDDTDPRGLNVRCKNPPKTPKEYNWTTLNLTLVLQNFRSEALLDSGLAWESSRFFNKSSPGLDHLLRSVKSVEMFELPTESVSLIHKSLFYKWSQYLCSCFEEVISRIFPFVTKRQETTLLQCQKCPWQVCKTYLDLNQR